MKKVTFKQSGTLSSYKLPLTSKRHYAEKLYLLLFVLFFYSSQAQTLFGTTRLGGNGGGGTINKFTPATNSLTVLKSLEAPAGRPIYASLVEANDRKLYGMTSSGGSGYGVIFSFDPSTSTYAQIKDFDNTNGGNPYGSLIQASDGKLYGMTRVGGSNGYGVIFSFDPASSSYSKIIDFDNTNGGNPEGSLVQASDGKLYGMTRSGGSKGYGVIFSFDPASSSYTKIKDFDNTNGGWPFGNLVQASDGKLYGMTQAGGNNSYGVIFSFDPVSSSYAKIMDFDKTNGRGPFGSLIQASDGKLYGMTVDGGSNSSGVIFSFDPASSSYSNLNDFDSRNTNGSYPFGSLMQASDGKLYGMTLGGGSITVGGNTSGVIFSFDPASSSYSKIKDFDNTNGRWPYGSLMQASDGKLYGMTYSGGRTSYGVIFSFDPASSVYSKLSDFDTNQDGTYVSGSLVRAANGKLYGMTNSGGSNSHGVIYSLDPTSYSYTKLYDFDGTNGRSPNGSLMQASNGILYGMTYYGGYYDYGAIFSFDPASSSYTKIKDFDPTNGSGPAGSLIQASDGKLYGLASGGGLYGSGIIFSLDPTTSSYTKLKDFDNTNGRFPYGSLMQASDGKLYGMTRSGGSNGVGVIFSFDPVSSSYSKLIDFDNTNGGHPYGSLMQASDGKLYGMTSSGGSNNNGVIFSFDPASSFYTKIKDFDNTNGGNPYGNLMLASDGKLYGMTTSGGSNNNGVIFSFDPASNTYTKLQDYNGANGARPDIGAAFIEVGEMEVAKITTSIDNNTICVGSPVNVNYTATGIYNAGNTFTAQLSDATGSFASPTAIGSVKATASGSISTTIPANTPAGTHYRLRVVSSDPAVIGSDNATDITINSLPIATISASGPTTFCPGGSVKLTSSTSDSHLWSTGATTPSITVNNSGSYSVTVTTNGCSASSKVTVVTVEDKEAPSIANAFTDITSIWPPNHKMVNVVVNYDVFDNCEIANPVLTITSNEPENGTDRDDVAGDWKIIDPHHIQLRAERSDKGNGRVYKITITGTDAAGNKTEQQLYVTVPHDHSSVKGAKAETVFNIKLLSNPTANFFKLVLQSNSDELVSLRVFDNFGRIVETRSGLSANGTLQIGNKYRPGIYFAEVSQRNKKIIVTMIKL